MWLIILIEAVIALFALMTFDALCCDAEEMEKPIPVFIDVTQCEKMANIYDYSSDTITITVAVNAPNPDRISDLLAYLFE